MKTFLLFILLLCTQPALADFTKGLDAYRKGDFSTAMQEFQPLAQQDDAVAQFAHGLSPIVMEMYYLPSQWA